MGVIIYEIIYDVTILLEIIFSQHNMDLSVSFSQVHFFKYMHIDTIMRVVLHNTSKQHVCWLS